MRENPWPFDVNRLYLMGRVSFTDDWKPFLLSGVIIGSLIVFTGLFMGIQSVDFFFSLLLLIGMIHVSRIFSDIHLQERGIYYFTIPASMEEKFFIKWLSTLVGYFLYTVLITYIAFIITGLLGSFLNETMDFSLRSPLDAELFNTFRAYLFFHAIYFLGSLYFKRSGFLKTSFFCIALCFFVAITSGVLLKRFYFTGDDFFMIINGGFKLGSLFTSTVYTMWRYVDYLLYLIIPIGLYALSYRKFRRIEVKG